MASLPKFLMSSELPILRHVAPQNDKQSFIIMLSLTDFCKGILVIKELLKVVRLIQESFCPLPVSILAKGI